MTALAGSLAKVDDKSYNCPGSITYYSRPIACWIYRQQHGSHGMLNLVGGIKNSCNCFFFQLGNDAKIERINEVASYFSFGDTYRNAGHTGIEVPDLESNGFVTSPAALKAQNSATWTKDLTAYVSIGQGPMAATPLQICMLGSAIANGGKVYQPTLIDHIEEWQHDRSGQRQKVISEFKGKLRTNLLEHGIKKRDMDNMREGMRQVVNGERGTGSHAKSKIWTIAGKTGTAQRKGEGDRKTKDDNRTWFMSFAPYEDPKIAVCVMVVNGKAGGVVAAPIAKRVIEQTLSLFPGNEGKYPGRAPKEQPLDPAAGSFRYLEKPDFTDDDSTPANPGEEEEAPDGEETEDTGPAAGMPEPARPAPKAEVIIDDEEDRIAAAMRKPIKPVQFRLKTDPPNSPPPPPAAPAGKVR
jgi:penicillin-binding protein 2